MRLRRHWDSDLGTGGEFSVLDSFKKSKWGPGCCGSVDWVLTSKPKGSRFDSQSRARGRMPGLQARSPVGGA